MRTESASEAVIVREEDVVLEVTLRVVLLPDFVRWWRFQSVAA
jgi:hypothetical protein